MTKLPTSQVLLDALETGKKGVKMEHWIKRAEIVSCEDKNFDNGEPDSQR